MAASRKQILIVEDDRDLQTVLKKKLESEGYACGTAETVGFALKALKETNPSLVILDLALPDANGTAFLRGAKDWLPQGAKVPPVIIVSGYGDEEIVDYELDEGAQCFLKKPLDTDLLLKKIGDYLSSAEA